MTRFLQPDEVAIDAAAESRTKRGRDRVACNFFHLRDLVYLHPKAASTPSDAIAFVQSLEAAVIAQKGTPYWLKRALHEPRDG